MGVGVQEGVEDATEGQIRADGSGNHKQGEVGPTGPQPGGQWGDGGMRRGKERSAVPLHKRGEGISAHANSLTICGERLTVSRMQLR